MPRQFTIGQLAKETNTPTSTIRYYERRNLLQAKDRTGGNYRLYDESALQRLQFIRSAQEVGFTLADISNLLQIREGAVEPCTHVQALIQTRLTHIRSEIGHLSEMEGMLDQWLKVCQEVCRTGKCGVIEGLDGSPS